MNNRVVFFDWGGVIADDAGDDFFMQLLQGIGIDRRLAGTILERHWHDLMRGSINDDQFWGIVRNQYGVQVPDDIHDRQASWPGLKPNPDVIQYIHDLKSRGVRTAVLSNVIDSSFDTLQAHGYYIDFEFVIASCHEGHTKPDPKIYEIALDRAHAKASDCVFVDDKQRNVDAASRLGFKTVLAHDPAQIISDLEMILTHV